MRKDFQHVRPVGPRGLFSGMLDYQLDIGVVGDVDLDSASLDKIASANETQPIFHAEEGDTDFQPSIDPWLSIQGGSHGQALFLGERRITLPKEWKNPDFPFIRSLPDGRFFICDTSFEVASKENAWILNRHGQIEAKFAVGSAPVEICPIAGGLIAVAYHPLSAIQFGYKIEPQQKTAIALFDLRGRLLTSFNHEAGRADSYAENIRCMTLISSTELIFAPESFTRKNQNIENPIIFYNHASGKTTVISTPYRKPEALSLIRGKDLSPWLLLASPEGFEDQVIAFDPARKISQYLGSSSGIFRGLSDSRLRFLRAKKESFENEKSDARFSTFSSGGFLAQEIVSSYRWIVADPSVLPTRREGFAEDVL